MQGMRLWHQKLIRYLPRQQLLGQHRECCALRGKGWGRKHSTVDYVFKYTPSHLFEYHMKVMGEMGRRGYAIRNPKWFGRGYRGLRLKPHELFLEMGTYVCPSGEIIYPEHDDRYLLECCLNLKAKGVELVNGKSLEEFLLELETKGVHS